MSQAQSTIENQVMNVSHADFEELTTRRQRRTQGVYWNVAPTPVTVEKYPLDGPPALLFFWDGQKVIRIRDEQLKEEMVRITDYSF